MLPTHHGDPAGNEDLRAAIAHWIGMSRGVTAGPEQVVVTSGAAHAVDLVTRVLAEPGDVVAVEEPGYPPVHELLRSHGADVVPVPVDDDGIVVDAIPAAARLVYVTPSHQYPLGVVMARSRRAQLLRWAGANNAAVLEDDYDTEFRHTARPLEPLFRMDRDGRVIYIGTFSKTLGAAVRAGFLVTPPTLAPAITAVRQAVDWCPPPLIQDALTALIADGHFGRHLRRARAAYSRRRDRLCRELRARLPAGYHPLPAQAGLHLAVVGPGTPPDAAFDGLAEEHGILLSSLRRTYQRGRPRDGFLVGFGGLPTADVTPAITGLCAWLSGERPR
ncbi:PLP-dependent aminotransferase family protein [Dactylosporangium sp. NPDC049742]|uniref:aminotransferase-like domain-containing protein n=1 Tax=Dactylosporangium sp. NPDC049742 TaxID=3154737 RepID=UPI00341B10C5